MRSRRALLVLVAVVAGLAAVVAVAALPAPVAAPAPSPLLGSASPTATVAASTASPLATSASSPTAPPSAPVTAAGWKRTTAAPAGGARVRAMHGSAGGTLIAVGHADGVHAELRSYVWTSQDGASWRMAPEDPVFMGVALSAVGPAPGGGVVAIGRTLEGNRVLRSADGMSWRRVADLEGRDDNILAIARWSGGVVAVGTTSHGPSLRAFAWTSPDGERFTKAPDADHFTQATIADVAVHRDRLVAVGYVNSRQTGVLPRAAVWTSADGRTWTPVTGDGFANAQMEGVVASDRGLVAVGSSSDPRGQAVWTSADGASWRRVPHGAAFAPGIAPGAMRDVVLGPGGYVAVGNTGGPNDVTIWTSADGAAWTRAELEPALRSASIEAVATNGSRVAAGGVAGDRAIAFWYSPP